MEKELKILFVEDLPSDQELAERQLKSAGLRFASKQVDNRTDYLAALESYQPDLIISDYSMPGFDGRQALELVNELHPEIPFIVLTGSMNEDTAVECMKAGASDYVIKEHINRLPFAVRDALKRKQDLQEKLLAEQQLRLQSTALNSAANAIVITDRTGDIQWVNPAYTRLTGYSAEEVLGKNPRILKSGKQDQVYYQRLWDTILSGQVWEGELINKRKDSTLYTEKETITPLLDEKGEVTHFIAIKEDITQRKEAELQQLYRLAEMETLVKITSALRIAQTVEEAMPILLHETLTLMQLSAGAIWLYQQKTGKLRIVAAEGWLSEVGTLELEPGEGIPGEIFKCKKTVVSSEFINDPVVHPHLAEKIPPGWGGACLPIFSLDEIIGVFFVASISSRIIRSNEIKTLESLASIAGITLQRMTFHEETLKHLQQLQVLRTIDQSIASIFDLNLTLELICTQVRDYFSADATGVLLFSPQEGVLRYAAGNGFISPLYKRTNLRFGSDPGGIAAQERRTIYIIDLKFSEPVFVRQSLVAQENFVSYITVPLIAKGEVKGILELFFRQPYQMDESWQDFLDSLALQTAIAIDNLQLFENLQTSNLELVQAYDATIEGWSRAMDLRDEETENHTRRVMEMTIELAQVLGVLEKELIHLRRGALLHDIGKIGVPDEILHKPGPLTDEEWVIMRKHPVFAFEMISPIEYLRPALDIPYCHHEKWDGTGYPRGLKGEQIPLAGRIFAIVDVWDALRSDRPYRKAWPEDKVIDYIRSQSGTHFDPKIVEVFLNMLRKS